MLLESIIDSHYYPGTELLLDSLLPLIDLYIQEYKFFQNLEVFQKIQSLIEKLRKLAEKSNSIPVKIHSLVLSSRFDLVLGKFNDSELSLQDALSMAKEYELENFEKLISIQISNLRLELSQWQKLVNTQSSLLERLEKVELDDYIKNCQNNILLKEIIINN